MQENCVKILVPKSYLCTNISKDVFSKSLAHNAFMQIFQNFQQQNSAPFIHITSILMIGSIFNLNVFKINFVVIVLVNDTIKHIFSLVQLVYDSKT